MSRQVLTKNFVEILHLPGVSDKIQDLMKKWQGTADTSFPTDAAATEAGWEMVVAAFFDKRKSTNFFKVIQTMDGVGSIRKSSVDLVYEPMEVESVLPARGGGLSVVMKGRKRGVPFNLEYSKGTRKFGMVGKTNPRPFWFDESPAVGPESGPGGVV